MPFDISADALLRSGYLFKEAIPLFTTESFADWWKANQANLPARPQPLHSRVASHSFPKDSGTRRVLSFPNPFNFGHLSVAFERHWPELRTFFSGKSGSLSQILPPGASGRALSYFSAPKQQINERIRARVGRPHYLRTDISRFFPSIYTHSLEWVLDTVPSNSIARQRTGGLGAKLDSLTRNLQDRQSVGIPIGPDTSFIIAEVIGRKLDSYIPRTVKAIRHVDDIWLYAESALALERAFASLVKGADSLRLEFNSFKTAAGFVPEPLEASWVAEMRLLAGALGSSESIVTIFDRALALHHDCKDHLLLAYICSAVRKLPHTPATWSTFQALLLTAVLSESKLILTLRSILIERQSEFGLDRPLLKRTMNILIARHASLKNGYEVAQALWMLHLLGSLDVLTPRTKGLLAALDDDFVACSCLWLRQKGLLDVNPADWRDLAALEQGKGEHWLLAYESRRRKWFRNIPALACPFMNALLEAEVTFIDDTADTAHLLFGELGHIDEPVNEDLLKGTDYDG